MTKKISSKCSIKNKSRTEQKTLDLSELKAYAIKKSAYVQKKKTPTNKFSKTTKESFSPSNKKLKVQNDMFKDILDQSRFQCPVCLELMIQPTLLQCGHAYCAKCLQQLMIYKSCCGVCRKAQKQSEFQRSLILETLIEKIILQKSDNYLEYYCRVTDAQNWKKSRNISVQQLSKGSLVDFRDCQLKWRKGQITKIVYLQQTELYQMQIKYKKDGQAFFQTIKSDSGRYVKFTYYTRMKYLEPKPNYQALQNRISDQLLFLPMTISFGQFPDPINLNFDNQGQGQMVLSLQQNIQTGDNEIQAADFDFVSFMDELLQNNQNEGTEFIQLLG